MDEGFIIIVGTLVIAAICILTMAGLSFYEMYKDITRGG